MDTSARSYIDTERPDEGRYPQDASLFEKFLLDPNRGGSQFSSSQRHPLFTFPHLRIFLVTIPAEQLVSLAKQMLAGDNIRLEKVAISAFDHWIGSDELGQLDCADANEREARDEHQLSFWLAIRNKWPGMLALLPGEDFLKPEDLDAYINACKINHDGGSSSFQCAVIPAASAIYYENWDDTNVLWFVDRKQICDLLSIAENCGLDVLEYPT